MPSARPALPESQSYLSRLSAEQANPELLGNLGDNMNEAIAAQVACMNQPVKIIHKEHESVTAFCINKVNITWHECYQWSTRLDPQPFK